MSFQTQITSSGNLPEVAAFNVMQFCHWAGISRAQFYLEVAQGRIVPRKVGRKTLVPVHEAIRWMNGLPLYQR